MTLGGLVMLGLMHELVLTFDALAVAVVLVLGAVLIVRIVIA